MPAFSQDYGLLTGLAEGLKSGTSAYFEQKKRNQEVAQLAADREYKQTQQEMDMKSRGLMKTPSGDLIEDPSSLIQKREQAQEDSRRQQNQLGLIKAGYKSDETGGLIQDKSSMAYQKDQAEIGKLRAEAGAKNLKGSPENYKNLPQDKQFQIKALSEGKSKISLVRTQMDTLLTQLNDPNLPEGQKLQAAQNAAKLINSPLGADAVGVDESKRVLAYLDVMPQPFGPKGMKVGPDIKGFTEALNLQSQRLADSEGHIQNQVDTMFGRAPQEQGLVKGGGIMKNADQHPQDTEAVKWAQANPKDPRSSAILKANGL